MKQASCGNILRCAVLGAGLYLFPTSAVCAASFSYLNGDLIACFRAEGAASDLVVKIGTAAHLDDLAMGDVVELTQVTPAQLGAAFPDFSGLKWSVLGAMRGNTNFPQYPLQTVWVTSPNRADNLTGPVWKRQSPFTQGPVASQIEAIGLGAAIYSSQQPAGPNNTATAIVIDSGDVNSYSAIMTATGNLAGTFQGDVENTTPLDFPDATKPSRSLLYQLIPGAGVTLHAPGRLLGHFDFLPTGGLNFTAGPPPGHIVAVRQEGNVTTLDFETLPSFSYRLRYTDLAGLTARVSSWNTGSDLVAGDGAIHSLRSTNTTAARFHVIEALP